MDAPTPGKTILTVTATVNKCWCGVRRPHFEPFPSGATCHGTGAVDCLCGGDQCVCHNHGEVECPGCDDCAVDDV